MAVVYCRSSSGALSFKSNVSIATTTLDTWLGLSERANQKQAAENSAVHLQTAEAARTSVLQGHKPGRAPLGSFHCPGNRFAVASKTI